MKRILSVFITVLLLFGVAIAEEKPVNIKGVSLGMPIDEAREVLSKTLGAE